mmetsp:Transcript_1767/g.2090  ORF Transcript_1767/g.2090 Transcript_1767/m.2090 type:complete len:271 (+) Transcript_1767:61-873(+)
MAYNVQGKVALVTGGSSGIGRAICSSLAHAGARAVVVADIDKNGGEKTLDILTQEFNLPAGSSLFLKCDCSLEGDITKVIAKTIEEFGTLDIFVGNAGIGSQGDLVEDFVDSKFQKMFQINVFQHIWAAKFLVPEWRKMGKSGCMVIVASAAGLLTQIGSLSYSLSKGSAVSLAEFLAITYGASGLKVVCVCPMAVRTPMIGDGKGVASVDGILEPETVASETINAINTGKFLVTLPSSVQTYVSRKSDDRDRWVKGMQRLNNKFSGSKI